MNTYKFNRKALMMAALYTAAYVAWIRQFKKVKCKIIQFFFICLDTAYITADALGQLLCLVCYAYICKIFIKRYVFVYDF